MSKRKSSYSARIGTKISKNEDESTPEKNNINSMYEMSMPPDLFLFWKMCLELEPKFTLETFSFLDLSLVGPFYFMQNKVDSQKQLDAVKYHMMWRYYYDTPEFLTVMTSNNTQNNLFHIGYFRDNPNEDFSIVVSNTGTDEAISILGDNLFAAMHAKLVTATKHSSGATLEKIKVSIKKVQEYAQKEKFSLNAKSDIVNARKKKIVATTFHKAGIVVPIVNEIGYRPLHHENTKLKQLLQKIVDAEDDEQRLKAFDPIQELVTYVQFANDECDYGMGLELGIDLFCNGSKYFFKMSELLLSMAYELLNIPLYSKIIKAHFADRRSAQVSRVDIIK